ncbi:porin [Palleronia sp. KMU-117]|uniref:porin n=1 Tax=Palleronia sp. KMU-117 TaxID=3434108 RepID=UPI003D765DF6
MKKVLLASTALIMSAGFAAADVSVGGDGRMGVIKGFLPGAVETDPNTGDIIDSVDSELTFTSRIRISFAASGETDGGLAFGGSIRADNATGGAAGNDGSVFVEGAFGKLSMGDVDGAAAAAVGFVSGVGLTGLGDLNEIIYVANVGPDTPGALYEYSFGDFGFYLSADAPGSSITLASGINTDFDAWAAGANYSFGNFTFGLGYEDTDAATIEVGDPDLNVNIQTTVPATHWVVGGTASFGDFTGKAQYGWGDAETAGGDLDIEQWAVSGDYTFGATTLTAYYRWSEIKTAVEVEAYGIGAAYDLGGGASLVGGWANGDLTDVAAGESYDNDTYDFGISFTF